MEYLNSYIYLLFSDKLEYIHTVPSSPIMPPSPTPAPSHNKAWEIPFIIVASVSLLCFSGFLVDRACYRRWLARIETAQVSNEQVVEYV
jgi:hypothetical protein